ncbi:hypothetical protein H5410_057109 [Solanum commersonii]|uniref:Uncharacterized protein n=1 Tax=Solanum commersonii TaxID=4109 RepID=A0A9J5WP63_SOLCO|nr:hypothetical protein H5410_057109 [Solanum commersonii]
MERRSDIHPREKNEDLVDFGGCFGGRGVWLAGFLVVDLLRKTERQWWSLVVMLAGKNGSFVVVCCCWRELLAATVKKRSVGSGDCRKKKKINGILVVDSPKFGEIR